MFHDRRIGERDDALPEFDKAVLRQQRERLVCCAKRWFICTPFDFEATTTFLNISLHTGLL